MSENQKGEFNDDDSQDTGLALGIDFGNSKISAAIWDCDKKATSMVIDNETGQYQFPATLYFKGSSQEKNNGQKQKGNQDIGMVNPEEYKISNEEDSNQPNKDADNTDIQNVNPGTLNADVGVDFDSTYNLDYYVYDVKKLIGQKLTEETKEICNNHKFKLANDKGGDILYLIDSAYYTFDQLAKFYIEKIKDLAEKQFNGPVKCCTISVPHGFNSNQKENIRNAAFLAGLKNVFIINDPLSTAIYYASQNRIQKTEYFLIIDFGSSKLDVSIVSIDKKNSIKVLKSGGDSHKGGELLNYELEREVLDAYRQEGGGNISDEKNYLVKQAVEKAKKDLTFRLESQIKIPKLDGKNDLNYTIKREDFNELNREVYKSILSDIDKFILESGIPIENINHVLLQGDAIRVVALSSELQNKYQDSDVIVNLYDSVACGSAIYTAYKLGKLNNPQFNNFKIYDIIPLSIGIRTEGDLMSVILPRGSRIPIKAVKTFITTQDNQSNIKFEIYEGERKLIKDNTRLDRMMLKNLPQKNKGQVKVQLIFEVNEESILTVTARELSTGAEVSCEVTINECLSQSYISEMINEAVQCEKDDLMEKERIQSMLKLNDKIFEYSHLYEGNEDILRELEVYRNWIKHSSSVQKEEYDKKLKELNDTMQKDKNESKQRKQTATATKKTVNTKHEEEKNVEK